MKKYIFFRFHDDLAYKILELEVRFNARRVRYGFPCCVYSIEGEEVEKLDPNKSFQIELDSDSSRYKFDTLEDIVAFAAKKVDPCPLEGVGFFAYKKAHLEVVNGIDMDASDDGFYIKHKCIITLFVPPEAKRTGCYYEKKCRAEFAKVVKIEKIATIDGNKELVDVSGGPYYGESMCYIGRSLKYRVGEIVYADSFDDNKMEACSHGVHFFLEKEDAIAYY